MPIMANTRSGLVRVSSYMGLMNFLILIGIALRWVHSVMAPDVWFPVWMGGGFFLAFIGLGLMAWIDRRWVWPREIGINQGVNPITAVWAIQAAYLVSEMEEEEAKRFDRVLSEVLDQSGYGNVYREARKVWR